MQQPQQPVPQQPVPQQPAPQQPGSPAPGATTPNAPQAPAVVPPGTGTAPTTPTAPAQPAEPSEADRAAEMLRRALGLKKGPVPGDPNAPKPEPEKKETPPGAAETPPGTAQDPSAKPTTTNPPPAGANAQDPQSPTRPATPQDPTANPPVDPAQRAAEGLRQLLPRATTPTDPSPPEPAPAPIAAPTADANTFPVHGSVQTRYRLRRTGDDRDQDLSVSTSLDFGDAAKNDVTGRFAGRAFSDLDGVQRNNGFNGLDEAFDDRVNGYVFEAHADLRRIDGLESLSIGRQPLLDAPLVLDFDGVRAETKKHGDLRAWALGYAGVPVRYWEGSRRGDLVYGTAFGLSPWSSMRTRFDWVHLDDRTWTFDGEDDLLSAQWWQTLSDAHRLSGRHTWLDGEARDLVLRHDGSYANATATTSLTYRELVTAQRSQVTDLDPFSPILLTQAPYRQLEAMATCALDEQWTVTLGGDARQLRDDADEGQFNREYSRLWAGPSVQRLFGQDLVFSVQGEYWDATDGTFRTVSGDLRWRPTPTTTATLGSSYARFGYDTFDGLERDHVRDWYLRLQYRPRPSLRLDAGLELQDNDVDRYVHVRAGATWTF